MSIRQHTDRTYEAELQILRQQILRMGVLVEALLAGSMRALMNQDSVLAHQLIEMDHQVNRMEVETDALCLHILALRQPVASDLRFVTIALKLVTDLERIGDLGVNTCERILELNQHVWPKEQAAQLPTMATMTQEMVQAALDAFIAGDVERAERVILRDEQVDAYYGVIFNALLTQMMKDATAIPWAIRLQSIAKYLERVGDHATNLAEMVVFMIRGKDIRHLGRIVPAAHDEATH